MKQFALTIAVDEDSVLRDHKFIKVAKTEQLASCSELDIEDGVFVYAALIICRDIFAFSTISNPGNKILVVLSNFAVTVNRNEGTVVVQTFEQAGKGTESLINYYCTPSIPHKSPNRTDDFILSENLRHTTPDVICELNTALVALLAESDIEYIAGVTQFYLDVAGTRN